MRPDYQLSQLDVLEAEAIHVMREVAAEFERPGAAVLRRQGLDRACWRWPRRRSGRPASRSRSCTWTPGTTSPRCSSSGTGGSAELGVRLIVASVQDSIDAGRVAEETGRHASRNRLQTVTLLDAIEEHRFDALFGGARRDEEKARAKERVFSFRDEFGQWDPKNQRPELWNLYNARLHRGEHIRVFPLSNWTELDVWEYIEREELDIPSIYYAHERLVFERDGLLLADSPSRDAGRGRAAVHRHRAVPDGRRHDRHRGGLVLGRRRWPRSSPRWRRPGSPSAARPGATTGSARRRWKTASARGTSDGLLAAGSAPGPRWTSAVRHGRLGRRRQVHPDRAAAVRLQVHLRRPAGSGRADQPGPGRGLHQPGPAHRRAAGRAGAGHHHRRRLPVLRDAAAASSSSPTPPATSSTPATW